MENKTIERISVLALMLAILFGLLQYIPLNKTYDSFVIEMALKIISQIFFQVSLFIILVYVILISIDLGYGMKGVIPRRILKCTYNLAVLINLFIILFVLGFGLIITIIAPFSIYFATIIFMIFLIFMVICFGILGAKYVN